MEVLPLPLISDSKIKITAVGKEGKILLFSGGILYTTNLRKLSGRNLRINKRLQWSGQIWVLQKSVLFCQWGIMVQKKQLGKIQCIIIMKVIKYYLKKSAEPI